MTFRQLIAHVTAEASIHDGHQSPFPDRRQTAAILRGMTEIVGAALAEGEAVELGELGMLHIGGPDDQIWFVPSSTLLGWIRWYSDGVNTARRHVQAGRPLGE